MDKRIRLIIKIIAAILVAVIIPAGGIFAYRQSNEKGVVPVYNWSSNDAFSLSDITTYNLNDNGEFKILQLADPQFQFTLTIQGKSTKFISELISETQPDLIIITGDLCSSPINGIIYEQLVSFFDLFGIPYAVTFGNHDAEGRASKEKLGNILSEGEFSIFKYGPSNITGLGNYVVNVKSDDTIAWSLVMLDSNEYNDTGYDYIHQDQINWYRWNIENMKALNGGSLNSLAFFHIPLPEYLNAWDERTPENHHFGSKRENVCSSKHNSGLFEVMKELESTKGVFVGHDHISDYSITYQGIRLTYGLKTSYSSYGQDGVRGGVLITLTEDDFTVEQVFKN